jgi:hypothetical protein
MTDNVAMHDGFTQEILIETKNRVIFALVKPDTRFTGVYRAWVVAVPAAVAAATAIRRLVRGPTYKIVRVYHKSYSQRVIKCDLSLEQAQAHCSDPETSSQTARSSAARQVTKRMGPWFDMYEKE